MRTTSLVAAVSLGLALAACGKKESDTTVTTNDSSMKTENAAMDNGAMSNDTIGNGTAAGDMNGSATTAAAAMPAQKFVDTVAASDMFEIESGKLAEKMGSAAAKQFGMMLVTDHTQSTAELKKAIAKVTPAVALPTDLPTDLKAKIDALKAAKGAEFDKLFVTQQIAGHKEAIDALNAYAAGGDQQALKDWASKVIPTVQGHLTKLQAMPQ